VRVGIGEQLPFADGSFDVVLAQLVVQLMDDREVGVREMARVTRSGGTVAACLGLAAHAAAARVLGRSARGRAGTRLRGR
jgi:ubiquinone/menaquinone biosynthesis C-methylase UbiE